MSDWSREIRRGAIQLCLLAALPSWFIRREAVWL